MLRVMRLPLASLKPEVRAGWEALPAFLQSMPVDHEARNLIASYQIDGDHVNFFTQFQGGVIPLPCDANGPHFQQTPQPATLQLNFENRKETLLNCPVDPNNPAAAFLRTLLQSPQYMVVIDQTEPVIIPFVDNSFAATPAAMGLASLGAAGAAGAATAAPAAASSGGLRGTIIWGLLALLLLGGSIYGYLETLYPWPFTDEEKIAAVVQQKEAELLDQQLNNLLDKTQIRLDQAYDVIGAREAQGAFNAAALLSNAQVQDRDAELAEAKDAHAEALAEVDKTKKELERLAQEDAARQAELEALLKAQEEEAKALKEKEAQAKANEAKAVAAAPQETKALPKCETIKKQGKLPVLLLAMDGSGSMTIKMADGQYRMDSAFKAANTLIDRIDKNVDIRMYGIQGCPFARDYGVFKYADRGALKSKIKAIDPRQFAMPGLIFTPLVSALKAISTSAPANSDAVAIVISDGLDTCYDAPNFNICDLARQIHSSRPKLKIHVIYMGDKKDLKEIDCVPKITKGKIFSPNNTSQLVKNIEQASQTLVKVCQ